MSEQPGIADWLVAAGGAVVSVFIIAIATIWTIDEWRSSGKAPSNSTGPHS